MSDTQPFALAVLAAAAAGLVVLTASRLSERIRLPLPAVVLIAAALVVRFVPGVHHPSHTLVTQVVTVALVTVLFDGGMHIGRQRLHSAAAPILVVGVVGTFGTAAVAWVGLHLALGLSWYVSLLVATAVSPTDPTVVFSVLGRRQVAGRTGTILEGESGANDPVGIALMAGLLGAHRLDGSGVVHILTTFLLQMSIGTAIGVAGGWALLLLMRRASLPSEGLYPLRTLASAFFLYGLATVAHGSGFLAVFAAGIYIGGERAPYKREIERFHIALGSLGEIVAFVVLGLTVDLSQLGHTDTWLPGTLLGLALAVVIRPVVVGACLLPARLSNRERIFVQFAGLKGAVPILLGSYILGAGVAQAARLYGIVIVVVIFSVIVQGSLVGPVTSALRLPVRMVEQEPWAVGVRLQSEPDNVLLVTVAAGSPAEGRSVSHLEGLPDDAWLALLVRRGQLMPVRGSTVLLAGDEITVLGDSATAAAVKEIFGDG